MNRHDYSQSTVSSISESIINSKSTAENTVLSIEFMPYFWEAGIINNVVTWFEVLQVVDSKEQIKNVFEKSDSRFNSVVQEIGQIDTRVSHELNKLSASMRDNMEIINMLSECLNEAAPIPIF